MGFTLCKNNFDKIIENIRYYLLLSQYIISQIFSELTQLHTPLTVNNSMRRIVVEFFRTNYGTISTSCSSTNLLLGYYSLYILPSVPKLLVSLGQFKKSSNSSTTYFKLHRSKDLVSSCKSMYILNIRNSAEDLRRRG